MILDSLVQCNYYKEVAVSEQISVIQLLFGPPNMADKSQKKSVASTTMAPVALVFVILLSAPSFVLSGRIPQIPAGHRAQYLLVRPDGGYSAGYDTGHGHAAIAEGDAANEVRGEYVGGPLRVSYTAGVRGYIPTVEVLDPYPPAWSPVPVLTYNIPAPLPAPPPPRPPTPIETANARILLNPDGSYTFSYSTRDHSREESADARNNVQGSFSFVPPDDGVRRTVTYQAGAATGFVAQGAHLPTPPPPVPPTAPTAPTAPTTAEVTDPTDSTPPVTGTDTEEPRTEEAGTTLPTEGAGSGDASYAFAYRTPDQERAEISDAAGNVKGLFSFVAPDGVRRQVDYEAGANKGFIARGDHLPTPPPDPNNMGSLPTPPPDTRGATTEPPIVERTLAIPTRPPPPAPNAYPAQWNTRSWNTGSWPVTVPDPLRIDSNVGGLVVRNYLPPHPVKAGYVLDNQ